MLGNSEQNWVFRVGELSRFATHANFQLVDNVYVKADTNSIFLGEGVKLILTHPATSG